MKKIKLFLLAWLLLLGACQEDPEQTPTPETPENPPEVPNLDNFTPSKEDVNASVRGLVVDENGEPVAGAEVSLGNEQSTTDEFGHFVFENLAMNGRGTLVKVKNTGYFDGSRRFFPVDGEESLLKIELIPKDIDASFESANGATVDLDGGAIIELAPNSIVKADGSAYDGTVQVACQWLDPSDPRTFERMPGDLQGVNTDLEEVALLSYGMMAVELETTSGEALNIGEGATATITMPVPTELQASAPSEIPLWSFNEEYGIWVEEGTATLQDGKYVGEVRHFSFWNCDAPFDLVKVNFQLLDENERPLGNYRTEVLRSNVRSRAGYSDEKGIVCGLMPANEMLEIKVYDRCDKVIHTQTIGPFSEDTSLGEIVVSGTNTNNTIIRGSLVGCDGAAIEKGLILVAFDGQKLYHYLDSADFEIRLTTCESTTEVTVTGVDLDSLKQTDPIEVDPNAETDLGVLIVCGEELKNFIRLTVDGQTVIYPGATVFVNESDSTDKSSTFIQSSGEQQSFYVGFGFNGSTTGDYSNSNFTEGIFDQNKNWSLRGNFSQFVVSEFGEEGQPIKGKFSGVFENFGTGTNDGDEVRVSGEFSVLR